MAMLTYVNHYLGQFWLYVCSLDVSVYPSLDYFSRFT